MVDIVPVHSVLVISVLGGFMGLIKGSKYRGLETSYECGPSFAVMVRGCEATVEKILKQKMIMNSFSMV